MLAISACATPHTENGSAAASIHPETTLHAPTPGFILYPLRAMPHFPCIVWQKFGAQDRSAAKPFACDEARRMPVNIAKLPSVLPKLGDGAHAYAVGTGKSRRLKEPHVKRRSQLEEQKLTGAQ
jgi:hypothetical protein